MRDLAEAQHSNFIKKSKYFYRENIRFDVKPNDYINFVKNYITNESFSVVFKEPWTYLSISNLNWMANGWKIHISANLKNHILILNIVARYAIEKKINFKFTSNIDQFIYINGKNVSRASSGKFIVLYPIEQEFLSTLEDLYTLLKPYDGPYILSDRPYKDSKVVFYRYGEIHPIRSLDGYGTYTTKMLDDSNELISDKRVPYFYLPDFIEDTMYKPEEEGKSKLLQRYDIKKSLHFSAQGGAYLATYNDQQYVIKEARKFAGLDNEHNYAAKRLKKEYTTMKLLANLECVPMPIEVIEEFGNVYLVEEYIEGETLSKFSLNNSPLIKIDRKENIIKQKFIMSLLNIVHSCLHSVYLIHSNGIILNDISPNNIIYNSTTGKACFIDYEVAYHISDECSKINLFTPGFSSEEDHSPIKQDLHKLGLVFISCIMPINNIFYLSPKKKCEVLQLFQRLNIVPPQILETIRGLINYEFDDAREALKSLNAGYVVEIQVEDAKDIKNDIDNIRLIKNSVIANINSSSIDYLVASDPMGFITCEYSFGFGIFGVLYALKRIEVGETLEPGITKNIVRKFMTHFYRYPDNISPGLFVGLSGIAAVLADLGFTKEAVIVMERVSGKNMTMSDLAYGLAGRIVALLKLYKETKEVKYLSQAKQVGYEVKKAAIVRNGLYYWKDEIDDIYTGLTRGSSGIALALLYLFLETKEEVFIDAGINGLEGDLDKLISDEFENISFNSFPEGSEGEIYSPYIHNGIAGLGCVLIRYFLVTRNEKYRMLLNKIIEACDINLSLFPGYLRGMSGIMTFLQDCVVYLNSDYAYKILIKLSENIKFFQIDMEEVHGYAGDQLYRVSHDLFTGSSGVALVLHRNACLFDKLKNPFLLIDEYYDLNSYKASIYSQSCIELYKNPINRKEV